MLQFAASDLKEGWALPSEVTYSCRFTPEAAPRGSSREGLEPRERGKTDFHLKVYAQVQD